MNIVVTIALLLANAGFVALEFALITARRTKLGPLAEKGDRRAQAAMRATGALSFELAGTQLGITMSSLGLGFVTEPMFSGWLEAGLRHIGSVPDSLVRTVGFVVALVVVAFLHMVIGEMVPKNIAIAAPERTMLWLALPNRLYVAVFGVVIRALNGLANLGTRALGTKPRDDLETVHTAEEIGLLLHASRDEGLLEEYEHELLSGALGFTEHSIGEVMIPWERVTTVGRDSSLGDLEALFVSRGHSRIPVMGADGRQVMGFLHTKDLLSLPGAARGRPVPLGRLRRMLIVQPDRTLEDTLLTMQRARLHMAVVVDGGVPIGLVTLEDVLEQLVGDIRDESDPGAARPRRRRPIPRPAPGGGARGRR